MVRQLAWLLSAAVAAVATAAADPPKDPPPAPITVTPDEWERLLRERSDLLLRGDKLRMGRFDQDGNFIPYPEIVRASGLPGGPNPTSLPVNSSGRDNRSVYEHRSGRLIRGTLVANPREIGRAHV